MKTPFDPLSKAEAKVLKTKVYQRTISRQEWEHLEWDRRFANRRSRGVDRFWSGERRRLLNGEPGTRAWTDAQREAILVKKTPQHDGVPIEGHHKYNALDYPQLGDDPRNIYPATDAEHLYRWHGGNYQNDTAGVPLRPAFEEEF